MKGGIEETLAVLDWPAKAVDAVRKGLDAVGVPLPPFLAQLLALIVFGALAVVFFARFNRASKKRRRKRRRMWARVVEFIGGAAASIAVITILVYWGDNFLDPETQQIGGKVRGRGDNELSVELLDSLGESLGVYVPQTDSEDGFLVTFPKMFASRPARIVVKSEGCDDAEVSLRRAHFRGAQVSVSLDCNSG